MRSDIGAGLKPDRGNVLLKFCPYPTKLDRKPVRLDAIRAEIINVVGLYRIAHGNAIGVGQNVRRVVDCCTGFIVLHESGNVCRLAGRGRIAECRNGADVGWWKLDANYRVANDSFNALAVEVQAKE